MRFRSRRSRRRVIGRGLPVSSSMDAETFDRLRDEFNQVYDRIVKLVRPHLRGVAWFSVPLAQRQRHWF